MGIPLFNNAVGGTGIMFLLVPIFICIIFIIVIVGIIYAIVSSASRYHKNNQSPVLTVEATVVSKRTDVTHHHHNGAADNMDYVTSSTWYYVTFQVESGSRMEFCVSGEEFGMLAEGDVGRLTFQGTRYLGFQRRL
jgi:uncharacterized membrane protein (UPF0182 family)